CQEYVRVADLMVEAALGGFRTDHSLGFFDKSRHLRVVYRPQGSSDLCMAGRDAVDALSHRCMRDGDERKAGAELSATAERLEARQQARHRAQGRPARSRVCGMGRAAL